MIAALAVIAALANGATADALDLFPPKVSAVASPSEVRLGQEITLVITATYHVGVEVNLPDPLFPAGAPLEIAHKDSADSKMSDGATLQRVWQLRVYPWELGEFDIPPIQVTFQAGGKVATVATNAIPIRVIEVVGGVDDPKQMRSMAPPVALFSRSWLLVWIAAGVAIAFVIVFNVITYRRRKKKQARAKQAAHATVETPLAASTQQTSEDAHDGEAHVDHAAPVVIAPPPPKVVVIVRARRKLDRIAEEALARLRALELSGRLDSDRRGAYRDMVAIIRDYLAARYDVDAPELTTRELCQALTFRSVDAAGLTRAWLADCDVVKYAGTSATGDQVRGSLDGAVWLIDRTSPGGAPQEIARA
jgi:hypothetical protein